MYGGQVHSAYSAVPDYNNESMLEFVLGWVYMCGTIIQVRK